MFRFASLWLVGWIGISLATSACGRRASREIDVDEVQGYVNAVEGHLRQVRDALRDKDLESAEEECELARETLSENRATLAAYPEIGELEAAVDRAWQQLCYGSVSLALQSYFERLRAKDSEEARTLLERARSEHERCRERIVDREDYLALKLNLDSAPKALAELERELARRILLGRIADLTERLEARKAAILDRLSNLSKQPNQRELAVETGAEIKQLRAELAEQPDFDREAEWIRYASALRAELAELERRRAALVRRGRLLQVVQDRLPEAERVAVQAAEVKSRAEARELLQVAVVNLKRCARTLLDVLRREPALAKLTFTYKGQRRTAGWLRKHLASRIKAFERRLGKRGGRPSRARMQKHKSPGGERKGGRSAKRARKKPPAAGEKRARQAEKDEETKKVKKPRRRRIKRW